MHTQVEKIAQLAKRVLISPLDWGLGHATRCIPIIQELIKYNVEVYIATSGKIETLLKAEFPQANFLNLKGYNIQYSKTSKYFAINLFKQIPKIVNTIRYEHQWLQTIIEKYKINYVIADNRFGLHTQKVPCIFITHQLYIKTNMGRLIEHMLQRFNYNYINKFTECWVPDVAHEPNLSGALGHPKYMPKVPVQYIGPLSRFHILSTTPKVIYKAVVLLSGPEPQRTVFEKIIQQQASTVEGKFVLVRALPTVTSTLSLPNNWVVFNHLPARKLNLVLQQAECIISRTGYTTIMDIVMLKKKSILIPTPAQTEQVYLGKKLSQQGLAIIYNQKDFNLLTALKSLY